MEGRWRAGGGAKHRSTTTADGRWHRCLLLLDWGGWDGRGWGWGGSISPKRSVMKHSGAIQWIVRDVDTAQLPALAVV